MPNPKAQLRRLLEEYPVGSRVFYWDHGAEPTTQELKHVAWGTVEGARVSERASWPFVLKVKWDAGPTSEAYTKTIRKAVEQRRMFGAYGDQDNPCYNPDLRGGWGSDPHNTGRWRGRSFWSGVADVRTGKILEVYPYEAAACYDFNDFYIDQELTRMRDKGDATFFWVDDGKVHTQFEPREEGKWHGRAPQDVQERVIKRIERQISIKPYDPAQRAMFASEDEFSQGQIDRRLRQMQRDFPVGMRVVHANPEYGDMEGTVEGHETYSSWSRLKETVTVTWDDGKQTSVYPENLREAKGQRRLFSLRASDGALMKLFVPLADADRVAYELGKSGLTFDAVEGPGGVINFYFESEAEAEVAHEVIRQAFKRQIDAGKGEWAVWKEFETLQNVAEGPGQQAYVASLLKTALNVPKLVKDFGPKLEQRFRSEGFVAEEGGPTGESTPFTAEQIIDLIAKHDPTPHKEYTAWMVGNYARGGIARWEDVVARVGPALQKYHALKITRRLAPEDRDIGRVKGLAGLEDVMEKYKAVAAVSETQKEKDVEKNFFASGNAELLYDDATIKVVHPKTKEAACFFGINTRWCTAGANYNMFENYNRQGPLYIVLVKPENARYQFHFQSNQFMDERDAAIDTWELAEKYPILKKVFNDKVARHTRGVSVPREEVSSQALAFVLKPTQKQMLQAVEDDPSVIDHFPKAPKQVKWKAFVTRLGLNQYEYDAKGKFFVLNEWTNIEDFAEQAGDHTAQYAARVSKGDEWIDVESYDREQNAKDALDAAKPSTVAEINAWIEFHYAEEKAKWQEENESEGALDEDEILRFAEDEGNDEIYEKLLSGWHSGQEVGTQGEVVKALKDAFEDLSREGTDFGTQFVLKDPKNFWDTPIREILPLASAEKLIAEDPKGVDVLANAGWDGSYKEVFKVEQPYHGWSDWDAAAADERLSEEFHVSDKEREERKMSKPMPLFEQQRASALKEAAPRRALLPAALLGLMAPGTEPAAAVRQPAPIVERHEKDVSIDALVTAIARTENADPDLHNPGNLMGFRSGELRQFKDDAQGVAALKRALNRIADGTNPKFTADMTLDQAGKVYSGGDPNWAKNVSQILGVSPQTNFAKLIRGKGKVAAAQPDPKVIEEIAYCPECERLVRAHASVRLMDHLAAHGLGHDEAQALVRWVYERVAKHKGVRTAGQWGERSYDSDAVHDILDRHRPKGDEGRGFDQAIPEEEVPRLLDEADEIYDKAETPDEWETYFGVLVFLETHGSPLDAQHRRMALEVGRDLLRNKEWLRRWDSPEKRRLQLKRELRLFGGQMSLPGLAAAATTFEERLDEMCSARCFDREGEGRNPSVYTRHDGEMVLKVWAEDGNVGKVQFDSLGRDGEWHTDVDEGMDRVKEILSSWGD